MADYQRILSYLYRYEKAEKKECLGFVKAEQKSGSLKLTIQIDDERLLQGMELKLCFYERQGESWQVWQMDTVTAQEHKEELHLTYPADTLPKGFRIKGQSGVLLYYQDEFYYGTVWIGEEIPTEVLEPLRWHKIGNSAESESEAEERNSKKDVSGEKTENQKESEKNNSGEKVSENQPEIEGNVTDEKLANQIEIEGNVTGEKLANQPGIERNVTDEKLANQPEIEGNVTDEKLANQPGIEGNVTDEKLANQPEIEENVTDEKLANQTGIEGNVTDEKLANQIEIEGNISGGKLEKQIEVKENVLKEKVEKQEKARENVSRELPKEQKVSAKDISGELSEESKESTDNILGETSDEEKKSAENISGEMLEEQAREDISQKNIEEISSQSPVDDFEKMWINSVKEKPPVDNIFNTAFYEGCKVTAQELEQFGEEAGTLKSNQFLLKGYERYRHLLAGRVRYAGEKRYCIGVPGIYENREKYMADIYQFPVFLSLTENRMKTGSFGYWLYLLQDRI